MQTKVLREYLDPDTTLSILRILSTRRARDPGVVETSVDGRSMKLEQEHSASSIIQARGVHELHKGEETRR